MTTTVLVDTSVRSAANVLEWTTERKTVDWGGMRHSFDVAVMVRHKERDLDYEEQVRALPTITRLVREGHIIFATIKAGRRIAARFTSISDRRRSPAKGCVFRHVC